MTPEAALAAQPPVTRACWYELPPGASDWLVPGERAALWLPSVLSAVDELTAHEQLAAWDALAGKLLRECLFGDGEPRPARKLAEAVAAVAEQLAIRLGGRL